MHYFLTFLWRNGWLSEALVTIYVGAVALGKDLDWLGLAILGFDLRLAGDTHLEDL